MSDLVHELPMRWADIDQLNHVNNVVYLDYAEEARAAHVAAGELPDHRPRQVGVEYLRPLLFTREPVVVATRLDDGVLVQDIGPVGRPFARVTSTERPGERPAPPELSSRYALRVRRSDLGSDDTASMRAVFEYSQEARIDTMGALRAAGSLGTVVVARVDLQLAESFTWRPEAYEARSAVTRVGRSSFAVATLFDDGRRGRADAVLVAFDLDDQRSRPLTETEHTALVAL